MHNTTVKRGILLSRRYYYARYSGSFIAIYFPVEKHDNADIIQEDTTNSIKRRGYNTYKDNVEKTVINCTRDRKCGNIENARVNRTDIFELYNL